MIKQTVVDNLKFLTLEGIEFCDYDLWLGFLQAAFLTPLVVPIFFALMQSFFKALILKTFIILLFFCLLCIPRYLQEATRNSQLSGLAVDMMFLGPCVAKDYPEVLRGLNSVPFFDYSYTFLLKCIRMNQQDSTGGKLFALHMVDSNSFPN